MLLSTVSALINVPPECVKVPLPPFFASMLYFVFLMVALLSGVR